jgi:hypothetical protein
MYIHIIHVGKGWRALGCAQYLRGRGQGAAASRPALQGFGRARRVMSRTKGVVSNDAPHTAPALGYHARSLSLSPSFSPSLSPSRSFARSLSLSLSLPGLSGIGQSRQSQPPLECSVSSHELPTCVRGHMHMGMCVCARVHRKYLFVLLTKVETD